MVELGNCKEIYQKVCCTCTELFFKEKTVTFVVAVVSKARFPYNHPDYLYLIAIDWHLYSACGLTAQTKTKKGTWSEAVTRD